MLAVDRKYRKEGCVVYVSLCVECQNVDIGGGGGGRRMTSRRREDEGRAVSREAGKAALQELVWSLKTRRYKNR